MPRASETLKDMYWTKARVLLDLERYDDAEASCTDITCPTEEEEKKKQQFLDDVAKARDEHLTQEKQLYIKMLNNKKKSVSVTPAVRSSFDQTIGLEDNDTKSMQDLSNNVR